jgi:putative addiction module component (TIGR02574 family)
MSPNLDSLTTQCLALPLDQRVELTQRLWQSLEGELDEDAELFAEIERRDAEMAKGAIKTYPHDEVMRDARKTLGQ